MQRVRLGSRVLGAMASGKELTAQGIFPNEPEAEPLLRFAERLCTESGLRASRLEEVELHVWTSVGTMLCLLSPLRQECFFFAELVQALDALEQLPTLRRCALWKDEQGYVAVVKGEAGAMQLAEFGEPLTDAECLTLEEKGRMLAGEQALRQMLHGRRKGRH